ncbi:MAG: hypothetical protein IT372_11485 [Polyangiaceae bacterium]|nr:hypothetical protein [Polyangiaceae bacterium]
MLLAHDASAATCDALAVAIESALGDVELIDASSIHGARSAVATELFDACLVCLDLPPAPLGGARLADELVSRGYPVVLVTRSLRWLPPDAAALRRLPWIPPDAAEPEIAKAIAAASAEQDSVIRPRVVIDDLYDGAERTRPARLRR